MNPYYALTNGFTLPEVSGGASNFTDLSGSGSTGASFSYEAMPLNLKSMTPTESLQTNSGRIVNPTVGNGPVVSASAADTSLPKNTYGTGFSAGGEVSPAKYTSDQVDMFTRSGQYAVQSVSYFANAILSSSQYDMKKEQYNFLSDQYEAAAKKLELNMRDITRAAQADANVYKMQGAQTKAKQKTAQAATGFAVGKGVYGVMLDTTDARANYNVAMVMLKSEFQNAEVIRKTGTYRAQAAIARGNAKIADIEKSNAIWTNVIGGIGAAINSGFSFYVGKYGLEGSGAAGTKETKKQ